MKKILFGLTLVLLIVSSFTITPANAFTLHNYQTGLCLGVAAGNPNPGTAMVTWTCDGTPSQQWAQIMPGPVYEYDSLGILDNPIYNYHYYSATFKEGTGFALSSGLAVVTYDGIGFVSGSMVNVVTGSSGVIGVKGATTNNLSNGIDLILWPWQDNFNQEWTSVFVGDDFKGHACYFFENIASFQVLPPYVMGVSGGNPNRGTPVMIWHLILDANGNPDYYRHPDQYWCVY